MLTPTLALALSLGLAAPPAAAAPGIALDSAGTSRDFTQPPPGTPADQAIWKTCYDLDNDLVVEQATSLRLQAGAKAARLLERLRDPAQRGGLSAEAAEAIATRLAEKWEANASVMGSQWPVGRIRVCRYERLNFEGVMLSGATPAKERQLASARADVQDCVAKGTAVLTALRRTNQELEPAIAEADRALRAAAAPSPAAEAAPAPSKN